MAATLSPESAPTPGSRGGEDRRVEEIQPRADSVLTQRHKAQTPSLQAGKEETGPGSAQGVAETTTAETQGEAQPVDNNGNPLPEDETVATELPGTAGDQVHELQDEEPPDVCNHCSWPCRICVAICPWLLFAFVMLSIVRGLLALHECTPA